LTNKIFDVFGFLEIDLVENNISPNNILRTLIQIKSFLNKRWSVVTLTSTLPTYPKRKFPYYR